MSNPMQARKTDPTEENNTRFPSALPMEGPNLDRSVDMLATLLRDFGQYAFDLASADAKTTRDLCEKWAAHILYARPVSEQEGQRTAYVGGRRDWAGLQAYFVEQRRREQEHVVETQAGLQQILWTFIHELNQSLAGEQQSEQRMRTHLEELAAATLRSSLEEIKREVLSVVTALGNLMEERRQQQQRQMEDLYARIRELGSQLEEARQESALDALTQLYNRKALDNHLSRTLEISKVFREPSCLLLVDADHFKAINDTHGHAAGDAVLRKLADCLTLTFPRKGEFLARYGGEEFAIIFRDATLHDGKRLDERLLRAVRALHIEYNGAPIPLTVSIGLAATHPDDSPLSWVERADRALYRAKQSGRNRLELE